MTQDKKWIFFYLRSHKSSSIPHVYVNGNFSPMLVLSWSLAEFVDEFWRILFFFSKPVGPSYITKRGKMIKNDSAEPIFA